jgi:hypothetical protein
MAFFAPHDLYDPDITHILERSVEQHCWLYDELPKRWSDEADARQQSRHGFRPVWKRKGSGGGELKARSACGHAPAHDADPLRELN